MGKEGGLERRIADTHESNRQNGDQDKTDEDVDADTADVFSEERLFLHAGRVCIIFFHFSADSFFQPHGIEHQVQTGTDDSDKRKHRISGTIRNIRDDAGYNHVAGYRERSQDEQHGDCQKNNKTRHHHLKMMVDMGSKNHHGKEQDCNPDHEEIKDAGYQVINEGRRKDNHCTKRQRLDQVTGDGEVGTPVLRSGKFVHPFKNGLSGCKRIACNTGGEGEFEQKRQDDNPCQFKLKMSSDFQRFRDSRFTCSGNRQQQSGPEKNHIGFKPVFKSGNRTFFHNSLKFSI